MTNGYDFYFDTPYGLVMFPITPSELSIKVGSNNKVVNLINEGEVNVLKSPSLVEVNFEARFPMRKYPYSRNFTNFETYHNVFKQLKENKQSFRFMVVRSTPFGSRTWDTDILVALESYEIYENADEGDDVLVTFELKQFKNYGVTRIPIDIPTNQSNSSTITTTTTTSTAKDKRPTKTPTTQSHTIKSGDCLWNIAKKYYGDGSKWTKIYNANKSVIEGAAKKHGKKSSSNGHWIYPNTKLTIPK